MADNDTSGQVDDGSKSLSESVAPLKARTDAFRANIRDTAKWIIVSFGTIAAFAIGGSNLSQLGSMDQSLRLYVALFCLIVGAIACLVPLWSAINIMTMKMVGLDQIVGSSKYSKARKNVEKKYMTQFEPEINTVDKLSKTYKESVDSYRDLNELVDNLRAKASKDDEESIRLREKTSELASVKSTVRALWRRTTEALEFCSSEQQALEFDKLLGEMRCYGTIAIGLFAVFAWAANPAKDLGSEKNLRNPRIVSFNWNDEAEDTIRKSGVKDDCLKSGHPSLAVTSEMSGLRAGVLAIPADLKKCDPVRLIMTSDGKLVAPD
jgi:hypothetical protein